MPRRTPFKAIYCYEPNPILYKVLEANVVLADLGERTKVNNVGLGKTEGDFLLVMPANNLGAGFIQNQDNAYTPTVLARKDNNPSLDFSDYLHQKVVIKSAKLAFEESFEELHAKNYNKGIVKIDIEGMELTVIRELIKSIPRSVHAMVVFENHDSQLQFKQIIEEGARRNTHYISFAQIQLVAPYNLKDIRIVKGFKALFGNSYIILSRLVHDLIPAGSIVVNVIPKD